MSNELFDLEQSDVAKSFLEKNDLTTGADGLLRPKVEEGKNGKRELVIRFLPNFTREKKLGPTAIEKHIHYANFPGNPNIRGYYDCQKDLGLACPLCDTFWTLKNDKNPEISDRSKKINRSTKYYSYVYVVEDKQVPENEGKIFIYPFGWKIFQKIKTLAERSRNPVRAEDLINGANLYLMITHNDGGFVDYDTSSFETPGPIEIDGIDIELDDNDKPTKATQKALIEFLLNRDHDLEEFAAKEWSTQQKDKVEQIISILTNAEYSENTYETTVTNETVSATSVFDDDDDDDDDTVAEMPKKSKSKSIDEDEDEDKDESIKSTRKKVSKFFDDDDE